MSADDLIDDEGPAKRFCRRRDVVAQLIDDEMIVVDLESSTYLSLNASGQILWAVLAEEQTVAQLVDVLAAAYPGVPLGTVEHDVRDFLISCREAKLLSADL